jgi:multisubunit Na+/H+ antiporter MnhB subunit
MIWGIIAITLLILLIAYIILTKKKKLIGETNYRTLFYVGICFLPLGINNPGFLFLSILYIAIGLANKDKWGKEKKWEDFSPQERKVKMIIMIALLIVVLLGFVAYFLIK